MKSKEYLDTIALKRDKMKLKTKHELMPDEVTAEELKKLTTWGFYDPKKARGHH